MVHDPTPPGLTLLRVSAGSTTLDCTTMPSGALGPDYPTVACNVGGELQAARERPGVEPSDARAHLSRAGDAGQPSANTASATCSRRLRAGADVDRVGDGGGADGDHRQERRHRARAPATPSAGRSRSTNTGPYPLDAFTVTDALPAGTTLADVAVGGATFPAANLAAPKTAPDGSVASFAGGTVTVQGGKLAAMGVYSFAIDALVASGANDGATIANVAQATPLGGAAVSSPAAVTTVQSQPPPLMLTKRVTPHDGADRRFGRVYADGDAVEPAAGAAVPRRSDRSRAQARRGQGQRRGGRLRRRAGAGGRRHALLRRRRAHADGDAAGGRHAVGAAGRAVRRHGAAVGRRRRCRTSPRSPTPAARRRRRRSRSWCPTRRRPAPR